jgi:hypothetical protein
MTVSDGDPPSKRPSKRRAAENLTDATLEEFEKAVDGQVAKIEIRRQAAKALVAAGGRKPVSRPRMGPLK